MSTVGDAGASNSDSSFTGELSASPFSMDYYRSKITEFQSTLNALDQGYQAAQAAIYADPSPEMYEYLTGWITDYESKKSRLRATAEAINLGATVVNSAGGRLPSLSVSTLGVPFLLPFAAIAAVSVAAMLTQWGVTALTGLNDRLKLEIQLNAQTSPEAKAALAAASQQSDAAVAIAAGSGFSALAPYLKWAALAALAFVAWRAFKSHRAGAGASS